MKIRIPMEMIRSIYKIRAMINTVEFADIEWTENGEVVDIPPEIAEKFQFSGMDNLSFLKYFWDEPSRVCMMTFVKKQK